MNSEKETFQSKNFISKSLFYRFSQFVGFLLGARFFVAALLTFALYVSTFFLFNQDESFRNFVFDFKVHGIIFCTVLTILAGGFINQYPAQFMTVKPHKKLIDYKKNKNIMGNRPGYSKRNSTQPKISV